MRTLTVITTLAVVTVCLAARASAADDSTLLRIFLKDGTSLVSYGEAARVGDRIVFSMPTASVPNPPLQVVTLAADRVDWDRTDRYASAARADHYVQHQAEADYAQLSNDIAQALNDVTLTTDPARRLAIAEAARKRLSDWPADHFGYRVSEIRQMLGMLDEAIADLRASTGVSGRFDLSFAAFADPPKISEPVLPPPTPREAIESVLAAARVDDNAAERSSLLSAALASLELQKGALPDEWAAATRTSVQATLRAEMQTDHAYQTLTARVVALADRRARVADVRGLERLVRTVQLRDRTLGGKRPDAVAAMVAVIEAKLDAARRLQLARDRWSMREPVLNEYRVAIQPSMDLISQLAPALEAIKSLSGSSAASLGYLERTSARIVALVSAIAPPDEATAAHALLISAMHLARNAAEIRRQAVEQDDITRAWDASSAAAGALMLASKARADIRDALRPPQLK